MRKIVVAVVAIAVWGVAIAYFISWQASERSAGEHARPALKPQPPITLNSGKARGEFQAFLEERSPSSSKDQLSARLKETPAPDEPDYDISKEKFAIYVPAKPADPSRPLGIIYWINYKDSPNIPPTWKEFLDRHNLIFMVAVSVNHPDWVRAAMALDAVHNLKKHYSIDNRRVYLFSMAPVQHYIGQQMGLMIPVEFNAFVYIVNIRYFRPIYDPDQRGTHPPAIPLPSAESLALAKTERHVVIGELGQPGTAPLYYSAYQQDGFTQTMYTEVSLTEDVHYPYMTTGWIEKVLAFLDAPATTAPTSAGLP